MQNRIITFTALLFMTLMLSSCDLIEGIFKAGMGVGIFIVVVIVAIVIWIISRFSKK